MTYDQMELYIDKLEDELAEAKQRSRDLLEAGRAAYGFIQYIYCHDPGYPELKAPLDKLGAAIEKAEPARPVSARSVWPGEG